MTKEQYISNLHDSFVNFINHTLSLADMLILLPQATYMKNKKVYIVEKKDAKNEESNI